MRVVAHPGACEALRPPCGVTVTDTNTEKPIWTAGGAQNCSEAKGFPSCSACMLTSLANDHTKRGRMCANATCKIDGSSSGFMCWKRLTEPPHNLAWMMTNQLFYLINKKLSRDSRGSNVHVCILMPRLSASLLAPVWVVRDWRCWCDYLLCPFWVLIERKSWKQLRLADGYLPRDRTDQKPSQSWTDDASFCPDRMKKGDRRRDKRANETQLRADWRNVHARRTQ